MAEKSEKATPKKLRDARRKGQVAKSQDFPSAFTFIVSLVGTLGASSFLFENLSNYFVSVFSAIKNTDLDTSLPGFMAHALQTILTLSFPILLIVALVGVIINFLIIGPVFSFESMKFDLKKLNPVEGIKQKFKLKVLIDLIKSIIKITVASIIIYQIIWNMIPQIMMTVTMPLLGSVMIVNDFLVKVAIRVGILFIFVALFDLAMQKRMFAKEMMMEKFEVKQEYKDTEGNPEIKGKRRELSREIAYQEGPGAARRAKAIVTNPTHIAVAIGYSPEEGDAAPLILAMGQNAIAEVIIKIAVENHIPVMRNIELAQDLFRRGRVSDYIPEDTYKAIAEILKWIKTLEDDPDINKELFT